MKCTNPTCSKDSGRGFEHGPCADCKEEIERRDYLAASRIAKQENDKTLDDMLASLTVETDNEAFGCSVLWYEFEKDKQTLVFGHTDPSTLRNARAMIVQMMQQAYTAGVASEQTKRRATTELQRKLDKMKQNGTFRRMREADDKQTGLDETA